ncbi:hypothetical protein [Mycobacterium sp. MMS18-G62]
MRYPISSCLLAAGVVLACAPVASADPAVVAPPEVPPDPSRLVFIDNPAIVDPHPMPVESWSRSGDGLAVDFTSGVPECSGVHVDVEETEQTVTVELQGGAPPESVGRMCIMLAVLGTLEIPLQSPLGERQVLDKVQ